MGGAFFLSAAFRFPFFLFAASRVRAWVALRVCSVLGESCLGSPPALCCLMSEPSLYDRMAPCAASRIPVFSRTYDAYFFLSVRVSFSQPLRFTHPSKPAISPRRALNVRVVFEIVSGFVGPEMKFEMKFAGGFFTGCMF